MDKLQYEDYLSKHGHTTTTMNFENIQEQERINIISEWDKIDVVCKHIQLPVFMITHWPKYKLRNIQDSDIEMEERIKNILARA